ncbi:response regulator [Candidatus Falkowbacteria bacterium]|nr:MAG: response regulator [Candidatus Falkowbacteria bacterium]
MGHMQMAGFAKRITKCMGQKIILLGEDDMEVSEMYKIAFEKGGFRVIQAFNGEEVIKKAKEEAIDIILLDINMPKKDGFDVLKDIAKDETLYITLKNVPILMLSNYSNPQDIEFCMKNGAQDFIIKAEWDPDSIIKRIKRHLKME